MCKHGKKIFLGEPTEYFNIGICMKEIWKKRNKIVNSYVGEGKEIMASLTFYLFNCLNYLSTNFLIKNNRVL